MTDTVAPAPEGGALTVDGAVAAIMAGAPQEEATPEIEAPEGDEDNADPGAGDGDGSDTETEGGDQPPEDPDAAETPSDEGGQGGEAEGEKPQPLDPPHFWSAEEKAKFAALPREIQETVLTHEKNRDAATSKAIQDAREAEKRAQEAVQNAQRAAEERQAEKQRLDAILERAEQTFKAKWPEVIDWVATLNNLTAQHGSEEGLRQFSILKAEHEAETQQMQQLRAARQEAEEKAAREAKEREVARRQAFAREQVQRLAQIEPELVDPQKGPERFQRLVAFLNGRGISAEQLQDAGADELSIAYDAMRYREAQAQARQAAAKSSPNKPKPQGTPPVKPSAPAPVVPQQQRRVAQLEERLKKSGSPEDAVALLLARQKG